jgi:hypothetical protein
LLLHLELKKKKVFFLGLGENDIEHKLSSTRNPLHRAR